MKILLYNQDGTLSTEAQALVSPKPSDMSASEWRKLIKQFKDKLSKEECSIFDKEKEKCRALTYQSKKAAKNYKKRIDEYAEYYKGWVEREKISLLNSDGTVSFPSIELLISTRPNHIRSKDWNRILEDLRSKLNEEDIKQMNILKRKAIQKKHQKTNPEKIKAYRKKHRSKPEVRKQIQAYQKDYFKNYFKENEQKYSKHLTRCKRWAENNKHKVSEGQKQYRESNSEKIKARQKEYYETQQEKIQRYREANKEKAKEYNKLYRQENKEQEKIRQQQYYEANREKMIAYSTEYRKKNKEKTNAVSRKYIRTHSQSNPVFKLQLNMRSIATRVVKQLGLGKKPVRTQEMFGCSPEELKAHIESLFLEGMSWQNHGRYGWHIDHIRPVSSFSEDEIMLINHYTNLQPLWAVDNIKKSDKWN